MTTTCRHCGATDVESECSGTGALICQGQPPVPGCGAILTPDERHYYGDSCEECARAWGDQVAAWRKGAADPELDAMFDELRGTLQ